MNAMIRTMFAATPMLAALAAVGACDDAAAPERPDCTHPAPLSGSDDAAAPGFIVQYHPEVDAVAETAALAAKYHFTPTSVWTAALQGFAAEMTPQALAGVRCEASVLRVEHNARVRAF